MSFHHDPADDRFRAARRQERDGWTGIAYLIVAAVSLVLVARLWARVIQPWAVGVLGQLTWRDVLGVVALVLVVVAGRHAGMGHPRRRRAARGLRVVDPAPAHRATDPMASGEKSPAQGRVQGGRRPSRSDAKRP